MESQSRKENDILPGLAIPAGVAFLKSCKAKTNGAMIMPTKDDDGSGHGKKKKKSDRAMIRVSLKDTSRQGPKCNRGAKR